MRYTDKNQNAGAVMTITWQQYRAEVAPHLIAAERLKSESILTTALVAMYRLNRETKVGRLDRVQRAWAYDLKSGFIKHVWENEPGVVKSVVWRTQIMRCNRCGGTGWYSQQPLIKCNRCTDGVFKRVDLAEFRFELPEQGYTFIFHQPSDRLSFRLPYDTPEEDDYEEASGWHEDRVRGEAYPRFDSQSIWFYGELVRRYLGVTREEIGMPTMRGAFRESWKCWWYRHTRLKRVVTLYHVRRLFKKQPDIDDIPF